MIKYDFLIYLSIFDFSYARTQNSNQSINDPEKVNKSPTNYCLYKLDCNLAIVLHLCDSF